MDWVRGDQKTLREKEPQLEHFSVGFEEGRTQLQPISPGMAALSDLVWREDDRTEICIDFGLATQHMHSRQK